MRERAAAATLSMTFDDGPDPRWTPSILDALGASGARATFFVTPGRFPALIERIDAEGHEVAYHCGRHVRHSDRERDDVAGEARAGLTELGDLGIVPRRWRPPWGDTAPWTETLARCLGLELWGWSDDTEDWSGRRMETMLARVAPKIAPGAVVLMHDGIGPGARRSDCSETVRLVSRLASLARERDLELVSISEGDRASSLAPATLR